MIRALAAAEPGAPLKPFEYDAGPLADDEIEIEVVACGVCHSDVSMWKDDWEQSVYPFVPGHEVVGRVGAFGAGVEGFRKDDLVGLGWFAGSCGHCTSCRRGDQNLCGTSEQTIVDRHGGFATHVRCKAAWAFKLPAGLDPHATAPLFCGGVTVFHPLLAFDVKPTDHVGVLGIGGLGHLALQFLNRWGCHVTAFTSTPEKAEEARRLGAHATVSSRDPQALEAIAGSLDLLMSTVNVPLDWEAWLGTLAPKGRLHVVGAVPEPIPIPAFGLIGGQKSLSGSPVGSPDSVAKMLDFCARHEIGAQIERFPMSQANEAFAHLEAGKARYRIVLENDL